LGQELPRDLPMCLRDLGVLLRTPGGALRAEIVVVDEGPPGQEVRLHKLTRFSTVPFCCGAWGSQSSGWKPSSAAKRANAGFQRGCPSGPRPSVTVFMLSNTQAHGTPPTSSAIASSPRSNGSSVIRRVHRTAGARLYFR